MPAILAAPGACGATSNKRDLLDVTARARTARGLVWTFDPQHVANAAREWHRNPLTYVAPVDVHTGRARRTGYGTVNASETRAENLIGLLLLAAACGELPSRPCTRG